MLTIQQTTLEIRDGARFSETNTARNYYEKHFAFKGAVFARRRLATESSPAEFDAWCDRLNRNLVLTLS